MRVHLCLWCQKRFPNPGMKYCQKCTRLMGTLGRVLAVAKSHACKMHRAKQDNLLSQAAFWSTKVIEDDGNLVKARNQLLMEKGKDNA